MTASSSSGRHPVLTVLLGLVGLLLVGGSIAYFATDHGKALLPTLEQPSLNLSNITREKIQGQFVVKLRNHAPIELKIDSLHYETRVEGTRIAHSRKDRPLVVKANVSSSLTLPLTLNLPQLKHEAKAA